MKKVKWIIAAVLCALLSLPTAAKGYSEEVTLVSVDGDRVTIQATATGKDKKEARFNAEKSALHALFHTGFPALKSGMPMVASMRPDYEYLLYKEGRYVNYLDGEVKNLGTQKTHDMQKATVELTVSLPGLKRDLERNNIALSPAWQDAKSVKRENVLNPVIVVVPYVGGPATDFEAMRSMVSASPMMKHVVQQVSAEFGRRGYKTRDFISMLENSKTSELMNSGTQTDAKTMIAQQLPGDILVHVEANVSGDEKGTACSVALNAVEKQTAGNLASATYASGRYIKADSIALADYALKKVQDDFFTTLSNSFNDMVKRGREVVLDFTLSESVDDWDFDQQTPQTGSFFKDSLEEWLREKSFQSVYAMSASTDKYIRATLNVPLWDMEKGRSYSLANFSSDLRRFFDAELGDDYDASISAHGQKIYIKIE